MRWRRGATIPACRLPSPSPSSSNAGSRTSSRRSEISMAVQREFVGLASATSARAGAGGFPCQGLYWTPQGERPKTALIATHYNVDFAEHYTASYFAKRGFGFLGWNTRYRGAEDLFHLEHALTDIGVGVRWLRDRGVETVVLLGNSGGGSLMATYQADAELKGDLYISLNAHPGPPEVLTNWMGGSVGDER